MKKHKSIFVIFVLLFSASLVVGGDNLSQSTIIVDEISSQKTGNELYTVSDYQSYNPMIEFVIFAENYEVDRDLYATWDDPDLPSFLLPHTGTKRLLNLRGLAIQILKRSGIPMNSIYSIPLCTFRDSLPSYRKNGKKAGRIVNYIFY